VIVIYDVTILGWLQQLQTFPCMKNEVHPV